jgi:hypothetical protein
MVALQFRTAIVLMRFTRLAMRETERIRDLIDHLKACAQFIRALKKCQNFDALARFFVFESGENVDKIGEALDSHPSDRLTPRISVANYVPAFSEGWN